MDTRPWPRYFARMIDILVFTFVFFLSLTIVLAFTSEVLLDRWVAVFEGFGGMIVSNIVSPVVAMLPIALLLAVGQTPGKWLFGIRVRDGDGRRLGFLSALKREGIVYVRGLGLGLPLISLFTLITSHGDLKEEGITPWDKSLGLTVSHAPATWFWWVRATFGAILVLGISILGLIEPFISVF